MSLAGIQLTVTLTMAAVRCAVVAAAMTDYVDRGMTDSASLNTVVNETHPVDSGLTAHPTNSELAHSLCKLIGVVHWDINWSSSNDSDCIRSDLNKGAFQGFCCSLG